MFGVRLGYRHHFHVLFEVVIIFYDQHASFYLCIVFIWCMCEEVGILILLLLCCSLSLMKWKIYNQGLRKSHFILLSNFFFFCFFWQSCKSGYRFPNLRHFSIFHLSFDLYQGAMSHCFQVANCDKQNCFHCLKKAVSQM